MEDGRVKPVWQGRTGSGRPDLRGWRLRRCERGGTPSLPRGLDPPPPPDLPGAPRAGWPGVRAPVPGMHPRTPPRAHRRGGEDGKFRGASAALQDTRTVEVPVSSRVCQLREVF